MKRPQVQRVEVGRGTQRGVGGVEHLEAAVAAEAVDDVRRDPAARPVRGLQHHHVEPAAAQHLRRAQPGEPGADHHDVVRTRRTSALPVTTPRSLGTVQRRGERLVERPVPEPVARRLQLRRHRALAVEQHLLAHATPQRADRERRHGKHRRAGARRARAPP